MSCNRSYIQMFNRRHLHTCIFTRTLVFIEEQFIILYSFQCSKELNSNYVRVLCGVARRHLIIICITPHYIIQSWKRNVALNVDSKTDEKHTGNPINLKSERTIICHVSNLDN